MQEKYGFVYIWRDRKYNRYYIGCHWGREDDGYICSSWWMKRAYKKRPQDFKRRILKMNITNRKELYEEEYKWLSLTKKEELRIRYYNLHNHYFGHWSTDEEKNKSSIEKMRNSLKEYYKTPGALEKNRQIQKESSNRPEIRKKLSDATIKYFSDPEARKKSSQRQKEKFSTLEMKLKMSEVRKKQWANSEFKAMMTEERKQRWENPEYRKKCSPGRDLERRREYMRNYMQIYRSKKEVVS